MAAKQIAYQMEAREAIRRGVKQLARAVKATLGPCGRNVVIEKSFGSPTVTKDGVTVAKEIELADELENACDRRRAALGRVDPVGGHVARRRAADPEDVLRGVRARAGAPR